MERCEPLFVCVYESTTGFTIMGKRPRVAYRFLWQFFVFSKTKHRDQKQMSGVDLKAIGNTKKGLFFPARSPSDFS